MERQLRHNGRWDGNGATDFFYVSNVILTALTEFLWNLCNGNGETATEWWKPGMIVVPVLLSLSLSLSVSFPDGVGHHLDPLQEAPQAS